MARFIKYTETQKVHGEDRDWLMFLNVDQVIQAVWKEHDQTLLVIINAPMPNSVDLRSATLKGEEAQLALKILKEGA